MNSTRKLIILLILGLIRSLNYKYKKDEEIYFLGDINIEYAIKDFKYLLVFFGVKWCSYCTEVYPEFKKASYILSNEGINLGFVEANRNNKLMKEFNFSHFPSFKIYDNEKIYDLERARTSQDFISAMRKIAFPNTKYLIDYLETKLFINSNNITIIFFGKNTSEEFDNFVKISKKFEYFDFANTDNERIIKKYNISENSVILFKTEKNKNYFSKLSDALELYNFININGNEKIMKFNNITAEIVFGKNKKVIFLFLLNNEESQKVYNLFNETIAEKYMGNYQVVVSYNKTNEEKNLAEFIGVYESNNPKIVVADCTSDIKKYLFKEEINELNFERFIKNIENQKVSRYYKSQIIQPNKNKNNKIKVVSKNFKEIVLDEEKDVLILFYSSKCNYSKEVRIIFNELGLKLKNNDKIIIAEMDITKNDYEGLIIESFPTIYLYPAKKKYKPIKYMGDRSLEDFCDFLIEEATYKSEAEKLKKIFENEIKLIEEKKKLDMKKEKKKEKEMKMMKNKKKGLIKEEGENADL